MILNVFRHAKFLLMLKYFFSITLITLIVFYLTSNYWIKKTDYIDYANDNTRFIAHAAGKIDGYFITNSLEALDFSYKKGFKLFELDILKTSDGFYVAAHDWDKWKKITNYSGTIPPNKKDFLQHKIYGKYSPMDITIINDWFKSHLDAILVTDKINEPKLFSSAFIDKSRLMMELFSWDQVSIGIKEGIKSAMPTGGILNKIEGDKVEFLKDSGITEIAMSRKMLMQNRILIQQINKSGIRIYAFNINARKGKGVKYVICQERKYFYGIYANVWYQNYPIDCKS